VCVYTSFFALAINHLSLLTIIRNKTDQVNMEHLSYNFDEK
jgi:hypothetical protein